MRIVGALGCVLVVSLAGFVSPTLIQPVEADGDLYWAPGTSEPAASAFDFQLSRESPAINSGVSLPADWPDPLRELDKDAPDRGAIPFATAPLEVGRRTGQTPARLNP